MSTRSSGLDVDLESQQTALLIATNTPRERWRCILLILQERNLIPRADTAEKGSLAFDKVSSSMSSYSIISAGDMGDLQTTSVEVSSASPGENDNCSSDAELQRANIFRMVKEKDVNSLQRFGGILGIAEALDTDLENGIPGHEEDLRSRSIASILSPTQAPIHSLFQTVLRSCNSYVIFLLFVSAMLSLGFGIMEEGLRNGWYEGVILLLAIIILVVVPVLRDFRLKHSQEKSGNERTLEMRHIDVDVFRGGCPQKVSICNVLLGDIVCLKSESLVPADGLFISGESLKLDDELQTIVNEESPFLFYGAKVIDGTGRRERIPSEVGSLRSYRMND